MGAVTITATGAGNVTAPAYTYAVIVEAWGPGLDGDPGLEDNPEVVGNSATGGPGGLGGGYVKKTLTASAGQILYWNVDNIFSLSSWFNLGTNSSAAASGGYSVSFGSYRTPATSNTFDVEYSGGNGGSGSVTLGRAGGGGGGGAGPGGTGSTGGTASGSTAGVGGAYGGGNGGNNGAQPGGGGGGGSSGFGEGTGGAGQLRYTFLTATPLDSLTYSLGIGAITFQSGRSTSLDSVTIALSISDLVFGRRTALDPLAYAMTVSSIGFSTSGGTAPVTPTNLVLPNRSPSTRSLQATWASLRFRQNDTVVGRTQKLELLRQRMQSELLMLAVTLEGIPTASQRLLRYRATAPLQLIAASSLGDADVAATASKVFAVKVNGATIGSITFAASASVGVAAFTTTSIATGALLEIYAPAAPDATLSNITLELAATRS